MQIFGFTFAIEIKSTNRTTKKKYKSITFTKRGFCKGTDYCESNPISPPK